MTPCSAWVPFKPLSAGRNSSRHVSLVGLSFSDTSPDDLSNLLTLETLDNVRVDQALFDRYAAEFNAFDAIPGNTVTVVPEPSAIFLCTAAWILGWAFRPTGGTLRVRFANQANFTPLLGTTFDFFNWPGLLDTNNRFDAIELPPGTQWDLNQLYMTGTAKLTAIPEPPAVVLFACGTPVWILVWAFRQRQQARQVSSDESHHCTIDSLKPESAPRKRPPTLLQRAAGGEVPWVNSTLSAAGHRLKSWTSRYLLRAGRGVMYCSTPVSEREQYLLTAPSKLSTIGRCPPYEVDLTDVQLGGSLAGNDSSDASSTMSFQSAGGVDCREWSLP